MHSQTYFARATTPHVADVQLIKPQYCTYLSRQFSNHAIRKRCGKFQRVQMHSQTCFSRTTKPYVADAHLIKPLYILTLTIFKSSLFPFPRNPKRLWGILLSTDTFLDLFLSGYKTICGRCSFYKTIVHTYLDNFQIGFIPFSTQSEKAMGNFIEYRCISRLVSRGLQNRMWQILIL